MYNLIQILIVSGLISLLHRSVYISLVKLALIPVILQVKSPWIVYTLHVLVSSYSNTIPEQTCLCLILYWFPKAVKDFEYTQYFIQLLLWLLLAGAFTSNITEIFPILFTMSILMLKQKLTHEIQAFQLEVKLVSDDNRNFVAKIKAYNKISQPFSGTTSRKTNLLIKKLTDLKHHSKNTRSLTEVSDNESNSSDLEYDSGSKRSYHKQESLGSLHNSSNESSAHENPAQTITNGEIKEIISTLISQEYLMWNPDKSENSDLDIMALANESRNIYIQSIQSLPGSTFKLVSIPKSKVKRMHSIRSMIEVSEKLSDALENIGEWDFDCFELIQVTKDPIFEVGLHVFNVLGLSDDFQIDNTILRNFLTAVERGYNRLNFYHNSMHAADVTASIVFLIQKGLSRCGNLIDIDLFALIVSAICHDIGHPGLNNAFLVATGDELALKYNDHSCLEMMHCNKTFSILSNDSCNITKNLSKADFQRFRKNTLNAILATDLQVHFDKLNLFRANLEKQLDITDDKFRIMAIQMCLKCADIGHGARKLGIHKQWSGLITKEFFRQGDLEINAGVPLTPLCDRTTCIVSKSQIGFLEVLVRPLFKVWEEFIELNNKDESELEIKICLNNITENIEYWDTEYQLTQQGASTFILDDNPPLLGN
jgi:3'5'-cyclic nucleotide phosphodiesterase